MLTIWLPLLWIGSLFNAVVAESPTLPSDWHRTHVGIPKTTSPSAAPAFHRIALRDGKTLAFLLTLTESNVLAALDPVGSSVAWRHVNVPEDNLILFRPHEDGLVTMSGTGGANVRLFEVTTGNIIWETQLHDPIYAQLLEPPQLGVDVGVARDETHDFFVLSNAGSAYRLNGLSGAIKWEWHSTFSSFEVKYDTITVTTSAIYIIGGRTDGIQMVTLDPTDGKVIAIKSVPGAATATPEDYQIVTSPSSEHPLLVWAQSDGIHLLPLPSTLELGKAQKLPGFKGVVNNPSLAAKGLFIGQLRDNAAAVYKVEGKDAKKIWDFTSPAQNTAKTKNVWSSGLDREGRPYVSRMYFSPYFRTCTYELYAPHGAEGIGAVSGFSYGCNPSSYGEILHAAIDVVNPKEMVWISRFAVTTSTGAFQMWQQDSLLWSREESLAEIESAAFLELPLDHGLSQTLERGSYVRRLGQHAVVLASLPFRIVENVKTSFSKPRLATPAVIGTVLPTRDSFGFHKFIAVATSTGKVLAIDSATGNVTWSHHLPYGDASFQDSVVKILVPQANPSHRPELFVVSVVTDLKGQKRTSVYHFDAQTGIPLGAKRSRNALISQYDIQMGLLDVVIVENSVVMTDETFMVHIYPSTSAPSIRKAVGSMYLSGISKGDEFAKLVGVKAVGGADDKDKEPIKGQIVWSTPAGPLTIEAVIKPEPGALSSLGKVMQNRTTLYNYANPHVIAAITSSPSALPGQRHCGVSIIDGVKGSVLYQASTIAAQGSCQSAAIFTGNWLVYLADDGPLGPEAGSISTNRIVSVEFYEGDGPDGKTSSADRSSFDSEMIHVTTAEKSFILPFKANTIAVTSSKFGIALQDIIVSTEKQQLYEISHRLLDPRRPTTKPTSQELEEGLFQYDPLLGEDSRRTLSRGRQIINTKQILIAPTELESTSVVFAYGLDQLYTRVAPSGTFDLLNEDFNRLQLLVTIVGLVVALLITVPLVRSKQLRNEWYN